MSDASEVVERLRPNAKGEDIEMTDRAGEADLNIVDEADSHDMFQLIHNLSRYLCTVEEDGEEVASGFQRIPNRRLLPDYFDIITDPIAFSTIRGKVQKKQYVAFSEFVTDVAQICHNAQVYNRPSAPIFGAAERLREIFRGELQKLAEKGDITADDAKLPDLGELPPAEESPPRDTEAGNRDDEDDEDNVDDETDETNETDDESDDEGLSRRNQHRKRLSHLSRRSNAKDSVENSHRSRGRPPMVLTPMEARISAILKGLRKFKDQDGELLISPFEKLPDKTAVPDYYHIITNPIALDSVKRKAKRKKYHTVGDALLDIDLIFENAKIYNEDHSHVYRAATELQLQARILAEQEKSKPDDDFRDDDGKLPLPEIQHGGEAWKVGDWVHIRNPNDLAKPIVAQIYRTWQDREGQKWINACWYYRPEQTVHRHEKHFYEHEVVKTGQYRDHQIGEVIDHCFVMFVTRFNRGRPRGFPSHKAVYVCESRYNEEKFRFNKIKTWASCVPDEVREKDYEMDLFEMPRRMRKVPSPIKHLLREDAKETDDLPRPTWGSPNAPPIVGAVHRRPLGPNDSPPPEANPSSSVPMLPAAVPEPVQRAPILSTPRDGTSDPVPKNVPATYSLPGAAPSGQHHGHTTPHFQPVTPVAGSAMHQTPVPVPHPALQTVPPHPSIRQVSYQYQNHQPGYSSSYAPVYPQSPAVPMSHQALPSPRIASYTQGQGAAAARPVAAAPSSNSQSHPNIYNPPRPPEVYTLSDIADETLYSKVRQEFQHDDAGRVLFFTSPPLDRSTNGLAPASAGLGHSVKYLAGRDAWLVERETKRKERHHQKQSFQEEVVAHKDGQQDLTEDSQSTQAARAVNRWFQHLDQDTHNWTKDLGLDQRNGSNRGL